jgi:hypothetical protein
MAQGVLAHTLTRKISVVILIRGTQDIVDGHLSGNADFWYEFCWSGRTTTLVLAP